jgi:ppGpp synthetase/RelA/SpoT-type nucleotidyltranferase
VPPDKSLHSEYLSLVPVFVRLQKVMSEQLEQLVNASGLTLGVPIESRVKSWESIAEKFERKSLNTDSLAAIEDLVGIRVNFLFQRDLDPFHKTIAATFKVHSTEDTSRRLAEAQFGYKSQHYILSLPSEWNTIPSLRGLCERKVEVQVRTLAQHIWAAASHKLQYKHEDSVPPPIRRSIYRVSALLETVDLEFSRVLSERESYVSQQAAAAQDSDILDVTVLEAVLDEMLPAINKATGREDYSDLLPDLQHFEISTRGRLKSLLNETLDAVMEADATYAATERYEDYDQDASEDRSTRLANGAYFTHVGLARQALIEKFGDAAIAELFINKTIQE